MAEAAAAAVTAGAATAEMAASGVASLLRVTGQSVELFVTSSFISLLLCFSVPVFVSFNVFAFQ